MNDQQIIFEVSKLIERAELCHENFKLAEAKRIVKQSYFMYELVSRLIIEANTTKELSNLASNEATKAKFTKYIDNLIAIETYFSNFIEYEPKTKTGYYMFLKDMTNFAPQLNIIE